MRAIINETGVSHYFNRIEGELFDFSKEQFKNGVTLSNIEVSTISRILSNKDTYNRFLIFQQNVSDCEKKDSNKYTSIDNQR